MAICNPSRDATRCELVDLPFSSRFFSLQRESTDSYTTELVVMLMVLNTNAQPRLEVVCFSIGTAADHLLKRAGDACCLLMIISLEQFIFIVKSVYFVCLSKEHN